MELKYSTILNFFSEISFFKGLDDLYDEDYLWVNYTGIHVKLGNYIPSNLDYVVNYIIEDEKNKSIKCAFKYFMDLPKESFENELSRFQIEVSQILDILFEIEKEDTRYVRICENLQSISALVNQKFEPYIKNNSPKIEPIVWLGTQKELGELFVELKKKGYIKDFNYTTIKTCFTNSNTINQILKPDSEKFTYQPIYPQIYTRKYNSKFDLIKEK